MPKYLDDTGLQEFWHNTEEQLDLNELLPKNAGAHNSVYRGKDITYKLQDGSLFTDIANGTFDDIFVGDYFYSSVWKVYSSEQISITVVDETATYLQPYRIAHLDKDYLSGDVPLTQHTAVIVPGTSLITGPINNMNTTAGGYGNSFMRTSLIPALVTKLKATFGEDHIIPRRAYFSSAVEGGASHQGLWYTSYADLMSECEICGSPVRSMHPATKYDIGTDFGQLAIYAHNPSLRVYPNALMWVRTVAWVNKFRCLSAGNASIFEDVGVQYYNGTLLRFQIG